MAPKLSKLVRRATFALVALAAAAVEVAARDGRTVLQSIGLAAFWVAVAVVVAWFVPTPDDPRRKPPLWVFLLLLLLAAAPFAVEPLRRKWTGDGYPLEIQMVCCLRSVGLGLAACAGWLLCLRMACVTSLFLLLFAAAMTNHPAVMAVLGLYTATGSVWLMLVYWSGLRSVFVAPDKAVTIEVQAGGERVPWLGLSVLVLLLGGAVALVVVGPKRAAFALGELMPTSGGTGETDPFARYGIGDGPEETAGDDAKAAGMGETDRMIEDNKNSLIDAVSDMYGPPHKPRKDQERMVAAGKVDVIQFHGKLPDNRRPSRDFDTARKGPKGDRKPESQKARGLFEIHGRTPLHVRLVAYQSYDPLEKRWLEARKPGRILIEPEGSDWMKPGQFKDVGWYLAGERHRLKTADMKSNLVPTPVMMTRFRINKVDRPEYFEWDYEGVLALAGRKRTPPGMVVTTDCRTLDPHRLPESAYGTAGTAGGAFPSLGEVPDAVRPEIARLAWEWAADRPHGWPQIEAVLTKLRTESVLDRDAAAPADHPAPVLWFLTESRRGPDYLFATAAALMLRTLDYPTRVCLGYYAAPEAYDPETAHTPVRASDLHFWPEVLLRDGQWLVVEPTPGYELLGPALPLSERILNALAAIAAWVWLHVVEISFLLAVLVAAWVRRRELFDALAVRLWAWFPGRTWREQVRGAVALLERRGRWAGKPRPRRQTIFSWLRGPLARPSKKDDDLDRLSRMAEWAAYAPDAPPPWSESEVLTVCQRVLGGWTLRRWRDPTTISAMGA
ncbi:MAG: transglutaminase domain-containing protein [Planctomycetes bacterium]|nr:transglutaminase domain-containing protein [Planctomycetota bacterium]